MKTPNQKAEELINATADLLSHTISSLRGEKDYVRKVARELVTTFQGEADCPELDNLFTYTQNRKTNYNGSTKTTD